MKVNFPPNSAHSVSRLGTGTKIVRLSLGMIAAFKRDPNVMDQMLKSRVTKIILGALTFTAFAWMVDSIRIVSATAPTLLWNCGFWQPLFGSAWLVWVDPLGPASAWECYCATHFNAVFAPPSVLLNCFLTLVYGALIVRDRSLTTLHKCLWLLAIATTNLALMPVVMPLYYVLWLCRKKVSSKVAVVS